MSTSAWVAVAALLLLDFCLFSAAAQCTQKKPPPPPSVKSSVTCVATNYPVMVVARDPKTNEKSSEKERDDWYVNCTVTLDSKEIYKGALALAHPTPYREAMDAIDEFRTKRAPQLVEEAKRGRKPE